MELNSIKDDFDRIVEKLKLLSSKSHEIIEQSRQGIEQALARIQSVLDYASPDDHKLILSELKAQLKEIDPLEKLEITRWTIIFTMINYPNELEKSFHPDISKAYRNIDVDIHTVNEIIANHFYQEGQFDLGDCFVGESKVGNAAEKKSPFLEMYQIQEAIKCRNLEPALAWAMKNHEQLTQDGSDIEVKLHFLQFVEILQNGSRDEALKYARTFLAPYATKHMAEIQKLMVCLLWAGRLDSSPHADLLSSTHWDKLAKELTHESPMQVTVSAGIQWLSTRLNVMDVITKKMPEWQSLKEFQAPVDLGREFQFHSIFVCPVSRIQASEENPPMMLSCGHVLCEQSITMLSENDSNRPFKCPCCSTQVEAGPSRRLHF